METCLLCGKPFKSPEGAGRPKRTRAFVCWPCCGRWYLLTRRRRAGRAVATLLAVPAPLVPVKALAEAKGRLAPWLNPIERRLLALAMLEDVVAALQAVAGLERPAVISPDREIWHRAEAMGCRVVEEEPGPGAD